MLLEFIPLKKMLLELFLASIVVLIDFKGLGKVEKAFAPLL